MKNSDHVMMDSQSGNFVEDMPNSNGTHHLIDPVGEPDADTIKMFVGQIPRSMDEAELRVEEMKEKIVHLTFLLPKAMFERYGPIYQLNILRDKASGQSRGCCFVTYFHRKSALEAQNALHNIKTLPGMHHAIQMKPADTENRNERKLFVGMVAKRCNETDVRQMFAGFGLIEDCTVLRDNNGNSKGCAFVTFASRSCAINAIKALHHSQTMEGCAMPLVVKFADSQKDKDQKKSTSTPQLSGGASSPAPFSATATFDPTAAAIGAPALSAQGLQMLQQLAGNGGLSAVNLQQLLMLAGGSAPNTQLLNASLLQAAALSSSPSNSTSPQQTLIALLLQQLLQQQQQQGLASASPTRSAASGGGHSTGWNNMLTAANALSNAIKLNQHTHDVISASLVASTQQQAALGFVPKLGSSTAGLLSSANYPLLLAAQQQQQQQAAAAAALFAAKGGSALTAVDPLLQQAYNGIQQYAATFPHAFAAGAGGAGIAALPPAAAFASATSASGSGGALLAAAAVNDAIGRQPEGPDGANLFIYHLPQDFGDADLMQTFAAFGSIISAKVYVDKQTNLSKCFGFVSYDSALAAQNAIQAMNGFQIGNKRLKVQLKRARHDQKVYQVPASNSNNIVVVQNAAAAAAAMGNR